MHAAFSSGVSRSSRLAGHLSSALSSLPASRSSAMNRAAPVAFGAGAFGASSVTVNENSAALNSLIERASAKVERGPRKALSANGLRDGSGTRARRVSTRRTPVWPSSNGDESTSDEDGTAATKSSTKSVVQTAMELLTRHRSKRRRFAVSDGTQAVLGVMAGVGAVEDGDDVDDDDDVDEEEEEEGRSTRRGTRTRASARRGTRRTAAMAAGEGLGRSVDGASLGGFGLEDEDDDEDGGGTMEARRRRKNKREKMRRLEVNHKFLSLTRVVGLPDRAKSNKIQVLSHAVAVVERYREETTALRAERRELQTDVEHLTACLQTVLSSPQGEALAAALCEAAGADAGAVSSRDRTLRTLSRAAAATAHEAQPAPRRSAARGAEGALDDDDDDDEDDDPARADTFHAHTAMLADGAEARARVGTAGSGAAASDAPLEDGAGLDPSLVDVASPQSQPSVTTPLAPGVVIGRDASPASSEGTSSPGHTSRRRPTKRPRALVTPDAVSAAHAAPEHAQRAHPKRATSELVGEEEAPALVGGLSSAMRVRDPAFRSGGGPHPKPAAAAFPRRATVTSDLDAIPPLPAGEVVCGSVFGFEQAPSISGEAMDDMFGDPFDLDAPWGT